MSHLLVSFSAFGAYRTNSSPLCLIERPSAFPSLPATIASSSVFLLLSEQISLDQVLSKNAFGTVG